MQRTCATDDSLLMKSEEWSPQISKRSKLEEARNTIFQLRYNRGLSYTAIKHFLAEAGITTSTAALSKFCKSRFNTEIAEKMKPFVMARIADLKSGSGNSQEKPTP